MQPSPIQGARRTKAFFPPTFLTLPTDLPGTSLWPLQSTLGSSEDSDKLQQLEAHRCQLTALLLFLPVVVTELQGMPEEDVQFGALVFS